MTQSQWSAQHSQIAYGLGGGSGSGSSGGSSTVLQNSEPWSGVQGPLNNLYQQAGSIANTPTSYFPSQTFADLAPEQSLALNATTQRAIQGSPLVQGAQSQLQDTIGGQYLQGDPGVSSALGGITSGANTQGNQQAQQALGGVTSGQISGSNPLAQGLYGDVSSGQVAGGNPLASATFGGVASGQNAGGDPLGRSQLEATARGDFLGESNPYLQDMMTRISQQIQPQVAGAFGTSGRFGSGSHAKALSDALSGAGTQMYYDQYGRERGNQLNAAQQLMSQGNIGVGNQLQAAGQLQGQGNQDLLARMGAAGAMQGQSNQDIGNILSGAGGLSSNFFSGLGSQLAGAGLQSQNYNTGRQNQLAATQLAPTLANQDYFDATQLAGVGDVYQQQQQRAIDDQMSRFNFGQMEPYNRASQFASLLQPGLGFGTSNTTTNSTLPPVNRVSSTLGSGLAGASVGNDIFGGGWGAGIGGGLGALLGLFG